MRDNKVTGISFEDITKGLRSWVRNHSPHEIAAVDLLIWNEAWLRRHDFQAACMTQYAPGLIARIDWYKAREFIERGYAREGHEPLVSSSSTRRILNVAVALGEDQFGLASLGRVHQYMVAQAFAAAVGLELKSASPENHHHHPEFIPCDQNCPESG